MPVPDPAVDADVEQAPENRRDGLPLRRDRLTGLDVGTGRIRCRRADQIDSDVVGSILELTASTRGPIC